MNYIQKVTKIDFPLNTCMYRDFRSKFKKKKTNNNNNLGSTLLHTISDDNFPFEYYVLI